MVAYICALHMECIEKNSPTILISLPAIVLSSESVSLYNAEHFATVGLNAGDGLNYIVLPGSNKATVVDIEMTSNIGIPGLWAYQVNQMKASNKGISHARV